MPCYYITNAIEHLGSGGRRPQVQLVRAFQAMDGRSQRANANLPIERLLYAIHAHLGTSNAIGTALRSTQLPTPLGICRYHHGLKFFLNRSHPPRSRGHRRFPPRSRDREQEHAEL